MKNFEELKVGDYFRAGRKMEPYFKVSSTHYTHIRSDKSYYWKCFEGVNLYVINLPPPAVSLGLRGKEGELHEQERGWILYHGNRPMQ